MDHSRCILVLLTVFALLNQKIVTRSKKVVTGPVAFLNLPYNGYIAEDATVGNPVYRLNSNSDLVPLVVDISNAPEMTRYFSLTGISGEIQKFQIDNSAGNVTLKTTNPTANRTTTFTVFGIRRGVVGISDHAFTTTQLTVNVVVTLNKHSPRFSNGTYSGRVAYGATTGHVILAVNANDGDNRTSGGLLYSIVKGNDAGLFSLDRNSGVLTLQKKLLDKSVGRYNLVIKANDKGTPVRNGTARAFVEVYVPMTAAPASTHLTTQYGGNATPITVAETVRPSTTSTFTTASATMRSTMGGSTTDEPTTFATNRNLIFVEATTMEAVSPAATRSVVQSVTTVSATREVATTMTTSVLIMTTEFIMPSVTIMPPMMEAATTNILTAEDTVTLVPSTPWTTPSYTANRTRAVARPATSAYVTTGYWQAVESVTSKFQFSSTITPLPTETRAIPSSASTTQTTAPPVITVTTMTTTIEGLLVASPTRLAKPIMPTSVPTEGLRVDTSIDALPLWALILIPFNSVIIVLGFALLIVFKCRKPLGNDQLMKRHFNSPLAGWLTPERRTSTDNSASHDENENEQHTSFVTEPWERHNRAWDGEIERESSNGPTWQTSPLIGWTPSRNNSLRESTRSWGKGNSLRYAKGDQQQEYVGEWSEVIGPRLIDDEMTLPLPGSPSSDP